VYPANTMATKDARGGEFDQRILWLLLLPLVVTLVLYLFT
jgi:hypothetical protein